MLPCFCHAFFIRLGKGISLVSPACLLVMSCRPQDQNLSSQKIVVGSLAETGSPTDLIPRSTVMISHRIPLSDGFYNYILCTGTIVSRSRILTASHCVDNKERPQDYRVFYGRTSWDFRAEFIDAAHDNPSSTPGIGAVREIRVHPSTDMATFDLMGQVSGTAVAAPLPDPRDVTQLQVAPQAVVAGFGVHDQVVQQGRISGRFGSSQGQNVITNIQDTVVRKLRWTAVTFDRGIGASTTSDGNTYKNLMAFRAGAGGGSACSGDSGGPTFMNIKGNWRLVGVTSNGDEYCKGNDNNVVNLFDSAFQNWIFQGVPLSERQQPPSTVATLPPSLPAMKPVLAVLPPPVTSVTRVLEEPEFVESCRARLPLRKELIAAGYRYLIQAKRATVLVRASANPQDLAYNELGNLPPCADIYARNVVVNGAYFWGVDDLKVLSPYTGRTFDFSGRRYLARAQVEDPSVCQTSTASCVNAGL